MLIKAHLKCVQIIRKPKYNLSYAQDLLKLQQEKQKQQQQQQNKDNKDQNKDKKKDDQKKDQQDKNKDQQNNKDNNQDQKQQQPQKQEISKDDAQRLLNALANDEKKCPGKKLNLQKQLRLLSEPLKTGNLNKENEKSIIISVTSY